MTTMTLIDDIDELQLTGLFANGNRLIKIYAANKDKAVKCLIKNGLFKKNSPHIEKVNTFTD